MSRHKNAKSEYALYRGDKFLDLGTAEYLSQKFEVSIQTIKWLSYPTALKRLEKSKGDRLITVKLD